VCQPFSFFLSLSLSPSVMGLFPFRQLPNWCASHGVSGVDWEIVRPVLNHIADPAAETRDRREADRLCEVSRQVRRIVLEWKAPNPPRNGAFVGPKQWAVPGGRRVPHEVDRRP